MKRGIRNAKPMAAPVQPLASEQLAQIKGGATAIEYGLALVTPPPAK